MAEGDELVGTLRGKNAGEAGDLEHRALGDARLADEALKLRGNTDESFGRGGALGDGLVADIHHGSAFGGDVREGGFWHGRCGDREEFTSAARGTTAMVPPRSPREGFRRSHRSGRRR